VIMTPHRNGQAGITVVEIAFAAAILLIMLYVASATYLAATNAQQEIVTRDLLEEETRRAAETLANRLRSAGRETVKDVPAAPASSATMRYRCALAFDQDTGSVWGPEERVAPANGSLQMHRSNGPRSLGLHVVSAAFSLEGRDLSIRLWAEGPGAKGEPIRVERRTHVTLRN